LLPVDPLEQASKEGEMAELTEQDAERLFNDHLRTEWKENFQEGGKWLVKQANGARYVPSSGSRRLPMMAEGRSAWVEFQDAWDREGEQPRSGGFLDVIDQAGFEATVEWQLVDPDRPWAPFVRPNVRQRIEDVLAEGIAEVRQLEVERRAEAERLADGADDRAIALINERRVERGDELLTEKQERLIRESRKAKRS
jgi:hypothetical protein